MLPKKERLSRQEFNTFLSQKGIVVAYNQSGTLKFISTSQRKLSVVTSSKHEKKAVSRNRLRRRIYSFFQKNSTTISGIFYASKQSYTLPYETLQHLFYDLLEKTQKSSKH